MTIIRALKSLTLIVSSAMSMVALVYGAYIVVTWLNYGRVQESHDTVWADPLLDQFMPSYDIVERHRVRVAAPPGLALVAQKEMDLNRSRVVRTIFRTREIVLGARPATTARPQGLLAETLSLGWGVLAEVPGREIVVGAVTQPWKADVVFRALPPAQFAAFHEPNYVKIAWTLRAEPAGPFHSDAITETRAMATDAAARAKFRRYWSCLSPGIIAIRWISLELVREDAERRAREAASALSEE